MSDRVHLKPLIKLIDGAWEAIPPTAVYVPNLVELAEQFCAEKNMDLEVWCACRSEKGMPNAAPDLLEALQGIVNACDSTFDVVALDLDAARAAIAKATQ